MLRSGYIYLLSGTKFSVSCHSFACVACRSTRILARKWHQGMRKVVLFEKAKLVNEVHVVNQL